MVLYFSLPHSWPWKVLFHWHLQTISILLYTPLYLQRLACKDSIIKGFCWLQSLGRWRRGGTGRRSEGEREWDQSIFDPPSTGLLWSCLSTDGQILPIRWFLFHIIALTSPSNSAFSPFPFKHRYGNATHCFSPMVPHCPFWLLVHTSSNSSLFNFLQI